MPQQIEDFEITKRVVNHSGMPVTCQGATPRALIRALKEAEQDAVVMFAVVLPSGKSLWAGVQGVIADFDGTGACCVLIDANVASAMRR